MNRKRLAAALAYIDEKAKRLTSLDQPQESDAVDMALEMGGSFIPGVGQALAARDFERARRADDEAGMAMAAASALPGGRLIGALKGFDPVMREIDVYHGSPHRFEEFDASKIGTGEGAQAYGHGIYVAESPDVAKGYAKGVKDMGAIKAMNDEMSQLAKIMGQDEIAGQYRKYKTDAGRNAAKRYDELMAQRQGVVDSPGNLYTADLPDEMVDRMLDWDKSLLEQPPAVRRALRDAKFTQVADEIESSYLESLPPEARALALKMINGPYEEVISHDGRRKGKNLIAAKNWDDLERLAPGIEHNEIFRIRNWHANKNAPDFYAELSRVSDKESSERLRQAGVPGIKYLDAGSRGQGGSGTRNFVVFPGEEKKVKILRRE
jgi:hypothetical protein